MRLKNIIRFSKNSNLNDSQKFFELFNYLHSLGYFNRLLNVILTLSLENRLNFNICTNLIQDNKHGLCETLIIPVHQKIFNKIFMHEKYQISLKKLNSSTTIHEIAHAIEKEAEINLMTEFMPIIQKDFANLSAANTMLKHTINDLMVKDLQLYNKYQHASEVFARYFELFALTQEVSGEKSIYIKDLEAAFINTQIWVKTKLNALLDQFTNEEVKYYNKKVVISHDYKPQWQNKIDSKNNKTWSKRFTSNFD